jgi:hypothetical protein
MGYEKDIGYGTASAVSEQLPSLRQVRDAMSQASQAIINASNTIRSVAGPYPPSASLSDATKNPEPGNVVDDLVQFARQLSRNADELDSATRWLEGRAGL